MTIHETVRVGDRSVAVAGDMAPAFQRVAEAFLASFAAGAELGASVAVTLGGAPVVDLWGGFADRAALRPWARDTVVTMMSVSKGVSALCLHMLADRGLVEVDAPVAAYWPAFGENGNGNVLLRWVLDHRAGLPYLDASLPRYAAYDHTAVAAAIARQAPLWQPGTEAGYHVLTQGFIVAEIIRRVTGMTLGQFFRTEVAEPLGLDYWIGLPRDLLSHCADFVMAPSHPLACALKEPNSDEGRFWAQLGENEDFNSVAFRTAEIPSANGHGTARAIARLYGALSLGGMVDGVRIIGEEAIARMTTEQHHLRERFLGRHYHQALGMILNSPPWAYMGPSPRAFGHHGAGGALGFADPDARLGFCYAMNWMHASAEVPPRKRLIDAVYRTLGA